YPTAKAVAEIGYFKALYYQRLAGKYKGQKEDPHKYDLRTSKQICEQIIAKYPGSKGAIECQNLLNTLNQPSLNVQTEQVNLQSEKLLVNVSFTNMSKIWLKMVRLSYDAREKLEGRPENIITYLNSLPIISQKNITLPSTDDLREHSTETLLDQLDYGYYALVISDNEFKGGSLMAFSVFHVSDLAFWNYNDPDTKEFVVVYRQSGAPLAGVKAEFFSWEYNAQSRRNILRTLGSDVTDKDGIARAPHRDERQSVVVKLTRDKDVLFLDDNFHMYRYHSEPQPHRSVFLFTDRAIYRPGQTIHFKGYVVNFDKERMPSIQQSGEITVALKDANGQEASKHTFTPNVYGTFSGEFIAPEGRLLGSMSLEASGNVSGSTRIQVEEYKRPTFEMTFEPASQAFKLGAPVTVKGKAMTYAGVPIDNATVQYRVVRRAHFPWFPWWMRGWFPDVPQMIIAQGITTSDASGAFTITFEGRGDESLAGHKPEFVFAVTVDITDVAGETRSAKKDIVLARHSFHATMGIAENTDISSLNNVAANATNLNGEDVKLIGEVKVAQLESPSQVLRNRYWNAPDMPMISENDYRSMFPAYAIPGKENMVDWKIIREVGNRRIEVDGKDTISLAGMISTPGAYRFSFSFTGDNGDTSSLVLYSNCFEAQKTLPPHMLFTEALLETKRQPGEQLIHRILTSPEVHIRYVTDRQIGIKREWLTAQGAIDQRLSLVEKDRGGLQLNGIYVYDNRVYTFQHQVDVPWTNKELHFDYLSYRDKTLPGADEEWHLKISGEKKDAIVAEFLATMYDASLDAFLPHGWGLSLYPEYHGQGWTRTVGFSASYLRHLYVPQTGEYKDIPEHLYRQINWFDFPMYGGMVMMRDGRHAMEAQAPPMALEEVQEDMVKKDADISEEPAPSTQEQAPVSLRTNLQETVFFMPHIQTDADGNITLKFKMNEALTRWKFLALAHTKDLKFGISQKEIVTQKDIMVFPHMPRFLRQKDNIQLTAKVHNMTDYALSGNAELAILDAGSGENVSNAFGLTTSNQPFQLPSKGSSGVQWQITVPEDWTTPVKYQVIARSGNKGDGEEGLLPVLTDRIFVTETMALHIPAKSDKTFVFEAFKNANSTTLVHQGYTVEFTSNPAWLAVQSLPYLQEYPHQCAEQIWNRLYANLVARKIVTEYPEIGVTYQRWTADPNSVSLMSNLSKNQELKSALLEETPWVRDAMSEEEQMRNIAVLLDGNRISTESAKAISTLKQMQLSNGGFPWFPGGRDNWYITQYIVEGAGHLSKLEAIDPSVYNDLMQMMRPAVEYIDDRLLEEYHELEYLVSIGKAKWEDDHLNHIAVHYLYARSFFKEQQSKNEVQKAREYYLGQAEKYWNTRPLYVQALIALSLQRWNHPGIVKTMRQSFEERTLFTEELGRYWKSDNGFYWYELPIERQSLMIELFEELGTDQKWIDELRLWLLKNKQTNRWTSTKATAAAVYALLMQEDNWLQGAQIAIIVGGKPLVVNSPEAGSGYVKNSWPAAEVTSSQSEIKVSNPNNHVAWGGAYWQYFEDMDKVAPAEGTPLKMRKSLHKQLSTDEGLKLVDLSEVHVGDKLISRIEIEVDRDMEFVHLKDMRASGLEPINVLSAYKWQGGLGYYESTADLATHFFFDYLPRGKYVFEYPVRVAHAGTFSNGIATLQCMYAPEFSSHSGGLTLEVKK
ncbi:MAG TPA: alpha-2-macroglobulin family protein, partial [Saprospiraceae bacterium]|nr:alpha-2-macroglobulin family protein [Saprospiraceae bacterium]